MGVPVSYTHLDVYKRQGERVDFVEDHDHRLFGLVDFSQGLVHHFDLFLKSRVGDIYHMNQQDVYKRQTLVIVWTASNGYLP